MKTLDRTLDTVEEKVDSFVFGVQEWANNTQAEIQHLFKEDLDEVRYNFYNKTVKTITLDI